jgi:hypothetical protein
MCESFPGHHPDHSKHEEWSCKPGRKAGEQCKLFLSHRHHASSKNEPPRGGSSYSQQSENEHQTDLAKLCHGDLLLKNVVPAGEFR